MDAPASIQTIAEVSIGLAGFSGLVVALRRDTGPLDEVQKYRLSVLFALSFGALFLALVPDLLAALSLPAARTWPTASGVLFLYSLFFVWWWAGSSRKIAKVAPEIFDWKAFSCMALGHFIVLLLQLGMLLGYAEARAPGIFVLGLTWYLLHATQQFVRMLFIQPRKRADNG